MNVATNRPRRAYAGVAPEQRDAQRRDALVAAGVQAFGERGYAAATIESICGEASVSTRDFYSYFAAKEDLLLAVYDRIIEQTMEAVASAVAAAIDRDEAATQVVRSGIAAFAHSMVEDERWARINFIEVVGVSAAVERRRRAVITEFGRYVSSTNEALALRGDVDRATLTPVHSVAMVGAIHETLTDWVLQSNRPPLEATIDVLADIFVAVLGR